MVLGMGNVFPKFIAKKGILHLILLTQYIEFTTPYIQFTTRSIELINLYIELRTRYFE